MPNKATVTSIDGLFRQTNPYGETPPGTLSVAQNVQIKKKGVLEPRPEFVDFAEGLPDQTPLKVWATATDFLSVNSDPGFGDGEHLVVTDGQLGFSTEILMSPERGGDDSISFTAGKAGMAAVRERLIFTDATNPIVVDYASSTARSAGLPMPYLLTVNGGIVGEVLDDTNWTSYRATFVKVRADQYTFEGAVSAAVHYQNSSGGGIIPRLQVTWDPEHVPLEVGDKINVYRVVQQTDMDLLGDRYQFAFEIELTSTEIANGYTSLTVDNCLDEALGAYLYTNGSQEGADKSHYMPPPSTAIATFKQSTWYAAKKSWHTIKVKTPYAWGDLTGEPDSTYGIGVRGLIGATTSGIPDMTGVPAVLMFGVEVGQVVTNNVTFPQGSVITAISGSGPYTVTFDHNAIATLGAGGATVSDVVEVNGVTLLASDASTFVSALGQEALSGMSVVLIPDQAFHTGFVTSGLLFVNPISGGDPIELRATNGQNWTPQIPSLDAADPLVSYDDSGRTNRLYFSEIDQPECVPFSNYEDVGNGEIFALIPMQETLLVAASDGMFAITGDGDDWDIRPFNDIKLLASDAWDVFDNTVYAWTQGGLVSITESGNVQNLSAPFIRDDIAALVKQFGDEEYTPYFWGLQVSVDRHRHEVWFNFHGHSDGWIATYIWNINTGTFVQQNSREFQSVVYAPFAYGPLVFEGTAGYLADETGSQWMLPEIRFNPIAPDDLGNWKQWLDVTLHLEDLGAMTFTPEWESVDGTGYSISATSGSFEHVVAPPQDYVYNKRSVFGFSTTEAYFRLMGISYRYRTASETLRQ